MERPKWIKDKIVDADFEIVRCQTFDDWKDWVQDDGCYLLIRTYLESHEIGVAICDYQHTILKEFRGRRAQDIYFNLFKYDIDNKKGWFTRMDHAAYLGKELKKAEVCLAIGIEYIQE